MNEKQRIEFEKQVAKLFDEGESLAQIAASTNLIEYQVRLYFRRHCERLGLSREEITKRRRELEERGGES